MVSGRRNFPGVSPLPDGDAILVGAFIIWNPGVLFDGHNSRECGADALGAAKRSDDVFCRSCKIKCRQRSRNAMAFVFSGIGIGMSCWFVTGLLGITLSAESLHNFLAVTKDVFIEVMSQTPPNLPMP